MPFTYLTLVCPMCKNSNYVRSVAPAYLETWSKAGSAAQIGSWPVLDTNTNNPTTGNFYHCDNCQSNFTGLPLWMGGNKPDYP